MNPLSLDLPDDIKLGEARRLLNLRIHYTPNEWLCPCCGVKHKRDLHPSRSPDPPPKRRTYHCKRCEYGYLLGVRRRPFEPLIIYHWRVDRVLKYVHRWTMELEERGRQLDAQREAEMKAVLEMEMRKGRRRPAVRRV